MKTRILIVEDNPIVAEDLKVKLKQLGYEVTAMAYSGRQALEEVAKQVPDIALMDIRLGEGINGIDTAAELKKRFNISVIYITAHADDDTLERAKRTEPYGYIVKPFDDAELRSAIEIAVYKQQADRKVNESRKWFETTLTSIGDGVITTDQFGKITFLNPVAAQLTGWTAEEVVGRPLEEIFIIINEYTREPVDNPVAKILKSGTVVGLANHTLLITKDKKELPIADSGAPIRNDSGDIIGVVLVFRDQIQEREAENNLTESEERFRTLVESSPQLILLEQEGQIIYSNPSGSLQLGYESHNDLVGLTLRQVFGEQAVTNIQKKQKTDCQLEPCAPVEITAIGPNGQKLWLLVHAVAVEFRGKATRIIVGQDITNRTVVEEKNRRLATALNQVEESVIITDPDAVIVYVNPSFEQITGYTRQQVTGKKTNLLKSGQHDDQFYKEMWEMLTSKQNWYGRLVNKKKNGTLFIEDASITPLLNKDGDIVNYVAVKRDVTEELEIERRLKQSQTMESIGTLAGGIAHDFNNILSSILGFTELAINGVEKDSMVAADLREVHAASIRAKELVKQILVIARKSDDEPKPLHPGLVAQEVFKLIRSSIPTTIELRQNIASDSIIIGNPSQMHQIFMNLCTNAAHAMEERGGILDLEIHDVVFEHEKDDRGSHLPPGKYIEIRISDTGTGISPEQIENIFEPYFTTKKPGEGTGLGLAVVYSVVESFGGMINVESTPGEGTTFIIHLPIAEKQGAGTMASSRTLPGGTERILVVDDEPPIVALVSRMLGELGYQVEAFSSSRQALDEFQKRSMEFDLVITDTTMPEITGDKMAQEILKIRPEIPIMICTGYNKKMSKQFANEIGVKGFFYKPFIKEDLALMVRDLLDDQLDDSSLN